MDTFSAGLYRSNVLPAGHDLFYMLCAKGLTARNPMIDLGGFHHIIAGSNKNFFLVVSGAKAWSSYLLRFFLPALLGNIIGGVSLVAFLNHAQGVAGKEDQSPG